MTVEDLSKYGVERLDADDVRDFLAAQYVGVLGIPTGDLPYMVPLSYAFDGEEYIYFKYIVGKASQKTLLSEETTAASFLVFDAPSETQWTSVALEGTLSRVGDHEVESVAEAVGDAWTPAGLRDAKEAEETRVYRFWIQHERGIRHAEVPPEMRE